MELSVSLNGTLGERVEFPLTIAQGLQLCNNRLLSFAKISKNKVIVHFSIECRKTKTKVITTANQSKDEYH